MVLLIGSGLIVRVSPMGFGTAPSGPDSYTVAHALLTSLSQPTSRAMSGQGVLVTAPGSQQPRMMLGALQHGVQHRFGEPAGEGVLLAHVVTAEQHQPAVQGDLHPVAEGR